MPSRSLRIASSILLGACGFTVFSACAADGDNLAPGRAMLRAAASTDKEAGIELAVAPKYLGSGERQGYLGVILEDNFGNGWFISGTDGVGYRFLETPSGFSMAASIGASPMRRERDGDDGARHRLRGMGDVNPKFQANVFLNYDGGPFHATAEVHQTLAQRRGTGVDLTASYDLLADRDDLVRIGAGASYANRSLMQTFFGVTPAQSGASGNPVYTPRAGVAGAGVDLSWRHAFGGHWIASVNAGVIHLRGDAGASPLTERRTVGVLAAGIAYRF